MPGNWLILVTMDRLNHTPKCPAGISKFNSYTLPEDIEALFVEIVIGEFKWLFFCSYNPHKSMITYHLHEI